MDHFFEHGHFPSHTLDIVFKPYLDMNDRPLLTYDPVDEAEDCGDNEVRIDQVSSTAIGKLESNVLNNTAIAIEPIVKDYTIVDIVEVSQNPGLSQAGPNRTSDEQQTDRLPGVPVV